MFQHSRLFDDQAQMRIRLETDAVQLILANLNSKQLTMIVSPAHNAEIAAIDDLAEREHLQGLLETSGMRDETNLFTRR